MKLKDLFETEDVIYDDNLEEVINIAALLDFTATEEEEKIYLDKTEDFGGLTVDFQCIINRVTHSWTLIAWVHDTDKSAAATLKSGEDAESLISYMQKMKFTARRLVNVLS